MTKAYGPPEFGNWYEITRHDLRPTNLSRIIDEDIEKTKTNYEIDWEWQELNMKTRKTWLTAWHIEIKKAEEKKNIFIEVPRK